MMKVVTYLEDALEDLNYDELGDWCLSDVGKYSDSKTLYPYQENAVKNAVKVLYSYFSDADHGKETLYDLCIEQEMPPHLFDVKEFDGQAENPKFHRLTAHSFFPVSSFNGEKRISDKCFFNRTCFWMATGSGKTLLIIKMIEIVDRLQRLRLMPEKEIMVLFPSEKIQSQFAQAVDEYNRGKARIIHLLSLKEYDLYHAQQDFKNEIKVYSYRSDLLSDEEKTKKVSTMTYDNHGDWYIFMDEAHKGDKEDSLRQDYITIMSRNGFLFNFSATFTDNLDFATTCFNFNLEKFIEDGYGKNVYLSESRYSFQKRSDDLSEKEKQLQVLKSLLCFTIIKKAKKPDYYHNPLMITLVNEVNTECSDTDLFFAEIAKIATGNIDAGLLDTAKSELLSEFRANPKFQFGRESLKLSDGKIESLIGSVSIQEILRTAFHADSYGKIEVLEGEKGKEFALKLATSEVPFALFRIGDASQYIREKLRGDYLIVPSYEEKHYFDDLNTPAGQNFNMLIGSRMFYEGWDSNRPNVMNFINIGTGDAKKFVLQSLGRGVRIEPTKGNRKRLKPNDSHKEQLLETLFVFATNRQAVEAILETMDTQRTDEKTVALKSSPRKIELLIPFYKDKGRNENTARFQISRNAYEKLRTYIRSYSDELLYILTKIHRDDLARLRAAMDNSGKLFIFNPSFDYKDIPLLLEKVIAHLSINDKCVAGIKELGDEIIHYQHIKLSKDRWSKDEKDFVGFVESDSAGSGEDKQTLADLWKNGIITLEELNKRAQAVEPQCEKELNGVRLVKLPEHYYSPLVVSKSGKLDHMKHIIDVKSEIEFVNNLIKYVREKSSEIKSEWMFSKIDQTIDDRSISIPYFSTKDNEFHDFFPDFIFWQKNGADYRITFVDPKGTEHASYLSKVDAFEKLFLENDRPKVFRYGDYSVTFSLKLVYDGSGTIPEKYKTYWLGNDDFSWLS